jgi:hypothetical protein
MSSEALAKHRVKKLKLQARVLSSEERADLAAEQACLQWQQAGIQHATYQHANHYALDKFKKVGLPEPDFKINFESVPGGAKITEENTIRHWVENLPGGAIKRHKRSETEQYYAKTQTSYLFTPETIQVQDLVIDCPSTALAPIFDQRPTAEQGTRVSNSFLRTLYSFVAGFTAKPAAATTDLPSVPVEDDTKITIKLK